MSILYDNPERKLEMKSFVEKITDPDFGDKMVGYVSIFGMGFVTAMLIFESVAK